jgi:hypothetical protein
MQALFGAIAEADKSTSEKRRCDCDFYATGVSPSNPRGIGRAQ